MPSPTVSARSRTIGTRDKYHSELLGWNSRLDPIQAAVLAVKLEKLDGWNARRRRVAARYHDALAQLAWLRLPREADWARHVYHLFVVRVPCRAALVAHLARASVETGIHYPIPPYRQGAFRRSVPWPTAFRSLTPPITRCSACRWDRISPVSSRTG